MANSLTAERLREVLSYDIETGVFRWRTVPPKKKYLLGKVAGRIGTGGYVRIQVDGREYQAHRLAWLYVHGTFPRQQVDHIDGNRQRNAIANLRDVSASANQQNQRRAQSGSASGRLGAHPGKAPGRFYAMIAVDGVNRYLGTFDGAEAAHAAYLAAKRALHEGCTI